MFIKKFAESDFIDSVEYNLSIIASQEEISKDTHLKKAIKLIELSATLLDEVGLEDEASMLDKMLSSLGENQDEEGEEDDEGDKNDVMLADSSGKKIKDKSIPKSSKQAVKNLKEKGWMFDGNDASDIVVHEAHDDLMAKTCAYCGEPVNTVKDKAFCSRYCADAAADCGLAYDCMDAWDADDEDMSKECKGWKKAPKGAHKEKAICKRHYSFKKD
jgi:hypothetical protein